MNKNVLYYYAHFRDPVYYSQLYYSLETLTKYYTGGFDVVVYYVTTDNIPNLNSYEHLGKFNLIRDFPEVKFIRSTYDKDHDVIDQEKNIIRTHDQWMGKWYHLRELYRLGYKKIFILDVDTIFFGNILDFFESHKKTNDAFCKFVYDKIAEEMCFAFKPMNGGQLLFDADLMRSWDSFYDKAIDARITMAKRAEYMCFKGTISENEKNSFFFFNEQFSPQQIFFENGANFTEIPNDILACHYNSNVAVNSGKELFSQQKVYDIKINFKEDENEYLNVKTKIIHYFTCNSSLYLPKKLRFPYMINDRNNYIRQNKEHFAY